MSIDLYGRSKYQRKRGNKRNDEFAVIKSAEFIREPIEENINIGDKTVKFFSSYDIENSSEIYNFYGYFGVLYLDKDLINLFVTDEKAYNSVLKKFRDDIVDAINESLKKLGNVDIKYDIHPVSNKYCFEPVDFEYKGPWSRDADDNYDAAIRKLNDTISSKTGFEEQIDFDKLIDSTFSILKSKYKNFEDVFRVYDDLFSYNSHMENSGNIKQDFYQYIEYSFDAKPVEKFSVLDKEAFYSFLTKGTDESDRDLVLDTFYTIYNETLKSSVKLTHFEGRYSDFIKEFDESTLAKAKKNSTSLFYFNDVEGTPFIGVNICVTDAVKELLKDKKISRANVKTLCNSLLREICKN